jgi:hypothetical protein
MSLINDALKKAARQRAEEQGDFAADAGRGPAAPRGRAPVRTQTVVLVGGAAVALVVVSAVITGILVTGNRDEARRRGQAGPGRAHAGPGGEARRPGAPGCRSLPRREQPAPAGSGRPP